MYVCVSNPNVSLCKIFRFSINFPFKKLLKSKNMGEVVAVSYKIKRDIDSGSDPWQIRLTSASQRWLHVWQNKLFTDVKFLVGCNQDQVECHKILLVLHSPVFETMFAQRWQSNGSEGSMQTIILPDEEPQVFNSFVEFVYTGSINVEGNDIEKLIALLLLGKKYLAHELVKKVVHTLKDSLSLPNVMQIYTACEILDEGDLSRATEEYILHNANSLFTSGEITKIHKTDLCKLLTNDELNVAEIDLFKAVYSWGMGECGKLGLNPEDSSCMKQVLTDILPLIRFTNMSPGDFSTEVVPKNILPLEDTVSIFRFMTTPAKEDAEDLHVKFNTTKRSLSYFIYNLRRLKGHGFDFGTKFQNFCFQTDRNLRIMSLGFFRAVDPSALLEVSAKIYINASELIASLHETGVRSDGGQDIFHLSFKPPVPISKDVLYTLSYKIEGKETFYKTVGESSITANCGAEGKVTFKFKEAPEDNDLDQVPEICFRM